MAWTDYPSGVRQFSGLIQSAADERFGAAATVELIAAAARDAGISLSFNAYSGIAKLYGDYVGARNAREAFQNAVTEGARTKSDFTISNSMITRQPWSPSPSGFTGGQFVLVKAEYTFDTPEGVKSGVFSHRYSVQDVHTHGQIRADLQLQIDNSVEGSPPTTATLGDIVGVEWSTS